MARNSPPPKKDTELIKYGVNRGMVIVSQKGSHVKGEYNGSTFIFVNHNGKDVSPGLYHATLRWFAAVGLLTILLIYAIGVIIC